MKVYLICVMINNTLQSFKLLRDVILRQKNYNRIRSFIHKINLPLRSKEGLEVKISPSPFPSSFFNDWREISPA